MIFLHVPQSSANNACTNGLAIDSAGSLVKLGPATLQRFAGEGLSALRGEGTTISGDATKGQLCWHALVCITSLLPGKVC